MIYSHMEIFLLLVPEFGSIHEFCADVSEVTINIPFTSKIFLLAVILKLSSKHECFRGCDPNKSI